MRRSVLSLLAGVTLIMSSAACAAGAATSGATGGGDGGSRYRVLIPRPQIDGAVAARDAERVGDRLRAAFAEMLRHTSVDQRAAQSAMRQSGIDSLDPASARQLAQQLGAANVLYVSMSRAGSGLSGDAQFIDVASGDVLNFEGLSGATADELASAILARVNRSMEGLLQAASCNDYLSSSQPERALETCTAALAVVPTSTPALYGKATALLQLGRHEESLDTYQQLLESDNANQEALLGAGLAASHLGRTDEALGFYNRYLELDPGNVDVRRAVAHQIATAGDFVSAYRVLEPAIAEPANTANAEFQRYLFSLAAAAGQRVSNEEGDEAAREFYEAALQAYGRAFPADSVQPDATQLRQAVGVLSALGRVEESLVLARQATVRFDTVASVWSQYASALASANRHAEAAQAFTRVIELDPDAENALLRRGMAYLAAGQRQQGLADLRQAAERGNPEQAAVVMFQEALRATEARRYGEAEGLLASAVQYAAADVRPQVVFFQGVVLYRQAEVIAKANVAGSAAPAREALRLFQRALTLLQQGQNAQKQEMIVVTQEYIANQEALVRAGSR
jgi:tetratricopeptide (TPR) repeat protein